jgi:hypothetical protein
MISLSDGAGGGGGGGGGGDNLQISNGDAGISAPKITFPELISLTRHSKFNYLQEALDYLPDKPFDKTLVKVVEICLIFITVTVYSGTVC